MKSISDFKDWAEYSRYLVIYAEALADIVRDDMKPLVGTKVNDVLNDEISSNNNGNKHKYANNHKRWTDMDISQLWLMHTKKERMSIIKSVLKRKSSAIKQMIKMIKSGRRRVKG